MLDKIEPYHVEVFLQLGDGIIRKALAEDILPYLDENFPKDRINEYIEATSSISQLPGALEFVTDLIQSNSLNAIRMAILLSNILRSRTLAFSITNTTTLISEMTPEQKEQLLLDLSTLYLSFKKKIFRLVYSISMLAFNACCPDVSSKAIGFPDSDVREKLYDTQIIDNFVYDILSPNVTDGKVLHIDVDALIVGLGCGAGVVAHTLSTQGFTSLVIEKGKYYPKLEMKFKNEIEGLNSMYQNRGTLTNTSQLMTILAGSTFGGGSTVNWLASLKTPFKVREEWHKDYGLDWAAEETFDELQQYVYDKIGASTENLKHSFTNQTILDGCKKLGYPVKEVPQNNGGHENHSCGFCYLGCKFGVKQGTAECWFKHSPGTQYMTETRVAKILHKNGKAYAAVCTKADGTEFIIKGPKKFIMCGGSLNTPIVLQHSGFKNSNIGKNLKLHPVSALFADFGEKNKSEPYNESILTTVSTQVADLDGKHHGARIEAILHSPLIEESLFPWKGSKGIREQVLKYRQTAFYLLIARDLGSGLISSDANKPDSLIVDYEVNKFDKNAIHQCLLATADIAYIEGALEIIPPSIKMNSFKCNKPKDQRKITDPDYVNWRNGIAKIELNEYDTQFGSAHQMSLCRMASTPRKGACDINGRLYECNNIFVADALAMPTASGVNPMVSTLTVARHVGLQIAKDLETKAKL